MPLNPLLSMKYSYLLFFIFGINALFAQGSLQFSDEAYMNADQQLYFSTNPESTGLAGSNQIWDFSYLEKENEVKSYLHPLNKREWALAFPDANLIIEENDLLFFIRADRSTLSEYGYLKGERLMVYDQPIVRFPFPFEFESSIEGDYSGVRYYRQERKMSGRYKSEADGYGTLILPGDKVYENVIRVRFSKSLDNNLSEEVIYRWYKATNAPVLRSPLLTIFTREELGEKQITGGAFIAAEEPITIEGRSTENDPIDAGQKKERGGFYQYNISPNPFSEFALIEYTIPVAGKVTIQSFDNNGRLLQTLLEEHQSAGNHTLKLSSTGVFVQHIRILVDDQFIASKKVFQIDSF